jgi:hypothetical protein
MWVRRGLSWVIYSGMLALAGGLQFGLQYLAEEQRADRISDRRFISPHGANSGAGDQVRLLEARPCYVHVS